MSSYADLYSYSRFWPRFWHSLGARIDHAAMGLSGLCAIHCIASAVLVALASAAGSLLLNPLFHEIGLTIAIGLGAVALGRGIVTHGEMLPPVVGAFGLGMMAGAMNLPGEGGAETLWTIAGVGVLAAGHYLNRRASC